MGRFNQSERLTSNVTYLRLPLSDVTRYTAVIVLCLGVTGNLFAAISIVYRGLFKKSHMFIFFEFMSIFDTIIVAESSGGLVIREFVYTRPYTEGDAEGLHGWMIIVFRYFQAHAKFTSVWIMIFANFYKLFALVKPLRVTHSHKRFVWFSCVGIVLFFFIFHAPGLIAYKLVNGGNSTLYIATFGVRPSYATFLYNFFFPMALGLYNILPAFLLPILALAIGVLFFRNYKKHLSMTRRGGSAKETSPYVTARSGVMALLPLSFVHVATTAPGLIVTMIEMHAGSVAVTHKILALLRDINHSVNFYVPMTCSAFYRDAILGRKT